MLTRITLLFLGWLCPTFVGAQFAPPAGQPGSTALHKDDSSFKGWIAAIEVTRGYQDIQQVDLGLADAGESNFATGPADGLTVSLGDGGSALIVLENPLFNGPGWDFAVFENAFNDTFLELAFVEVSSDGQQFVRFPATSLTPTTEQVGPFGEVDATKIHHLAGKYRVHYGTPFDLEVLTDSLSLDLQQIRYIRLVDVVGSIDPAFGSLDQNGNLINDPFPTPFPSSGFDLDAVGLIHVQGLSTTRENLPQTPALFPNPVASGQAIQLELPMAATIQLFTAQGALLRSWQASGGTEQFSIPAEGVHLCLVRTKNNGQIHRFLIQVF